MPISRLKPDNTYQYWVCHVLGLLALVVDLAAVHWLWPAAPAYGDVAPADAAPALVVGALGLILAALLWATGLVVRRLDRTGAQAPSA